MAAGCLLLTVQHRSSQCRTLHCLLSIATVAVWHILDAWLLRHQPCLHELPARDNTSLLGAMPPAAQRDKMPGRHVCRCCLSTSCAATCQAPARCPAMAPDSALTRECALARAQRSSRRRRTQRATPTRGRLRPRAAARERAGRPSTAAPQPGPASRAWRCCAEALCQGSEEEPLRAL